MMDIIHTLNSALWAFREGDRRAIAMWSLHLLLLTGLLTGWRRRVFSAVVCAGGELPGAGPDQSTLFLEHRAADDPLARSVINEAGPAGAVPHLNYHAVHHDLPGSRYALRQLYLHRRGVSAA